MTRWHRMKPTNYIHATAKHQRRKYPTTQCNEPDVKTTTAPDAELNTELKTLNHCASR